MKFLITGSAGFIGSALSIKLLERGDKIIGIDNHNEYYDPLLKEARLERHKNHTHYTHIRMDIEDTNAIESLFNNHKFDGVVNLAAQAGVRYSIKNPKAYIESNIVGFGNILEECRNHNIGHFVYASSSSVYGSNTKMPYSVHDNVNHPVSIYAATKKTNELMAHTYSHLFNLPTSGLRFFTVYGPYDRPDMALQKFSKRMLLNKPLKVFNHGNHLRDFTYIDDIVDGIIKVLDRPASANPNWNSNSPDPATSYAPYRLYNIGNSKPVKLLDYIKALEISFGITAKKDFLPSQPGDIKDTFADSSELEEEFDFKPKININEGIEKFVDWYKKYHSV
ncbi:NAD-dependent epimerase [Candidatus Pseudothioglobus singularis]|nr:NAD-dependent epimerase [Candidatus Pseudothioglobus singularis]